MAGPWEQYQTAAPATDGPWAQYQTGAPEKPGVVEDVAKTVPAGLARGVAGLVGLPGDVRKAIDYYVVDPIADRVLGPTSNPKPSIPADFPTSRDVTQTVEAVTGPLYKPQTTAGEYANTVAEFAPGMIFGSGTLPQRVMQAAVPAVTSETAGQITRRLAPEWEGAARALGAVGGAIGTAIAQTPRGANVVMQDSLRGVTTQELDDAYRLMQDAADLPGGGVQLTLNEALNQVTNGRFTRLQQLDRVVTNSGGPGAETMAGVYSQRPGQVRATGQAVLDDVAPSPYPANQAARRGQEAAQGVIDQTQAGINAMTRPAYQAAEAATIDPASYAALTADPLYARVLQQVRNDPALNRTIANLPDDSVGVVDLVQRQMRQTADNLSIPGQAHTNNLAAANYGDARTNAIQAAEAATGGATGPYAQARDVQSQLRQSQLQPLNDGPVGRISRMDPAGANASADMGRELAAPGWDRYHGVVQQSVRRMVRQDPRAAETLARDYVGDVLNQATRGPQGAPNVYGGAAFFKKIAGDDASMQNLQAMITQLPQGQQRWQGFQRFLEAMQATGYKAQKGSDTAFNQALQQQMREGGIVGKALETAAGAGTGAAVGGGAGGVGGAVLSARRALSDRLMNWRMDRAGDQIAWMLTSRESAPLLRQLANTPIGSARANALALRLTVLSERGANSGNLPAQPVP